MSLHCFLQIFFVLVPVERRLVYRVRVRARARIRAKARVRVRVRG